MQSIPPGSQKSGLGPKSAEERRRAQKSKAPLHLKLARIARQEALEESEFRGRLKH